MHMPVALKTHLALHACGWWVVGLVLPGLAALLPLYLACTMLLCACTPAAHTEKANHSTHSRIFLKCLVIVGVGGSLDRFFRLGTA